MFRKSKSHVLKNSESSAATDPSFSEKTLLIILFFPVFKVRVPEDTSPWKDVLQISAQDADANSKLVFSIHSSLHPDSTKLFHLDPKSGVLVMTEELDYEIISVHTLIVMVTVLSHQQKPECDGGHKIKDLPNI